MKTIKKIKKIKGKKLVIDIPEDFLAKEVEIIIKPYEKNNKNDWKKDFLSISQWHIDNEEVKIKSWQINEY